MAILILSALSMYLAYDLTRITKGAPTAWYVIIAAFGLLFVWRATELYFDVQSASAMIDMQEAIVALFVGFLFVIGLFMMARSFRRQLKASLGN